MTVLCPLLEKIDYLLDPCFHFLKRLDFSCIVCSIIFKLQAEIFSIMLEVRGRRKGGLISRVVWLNGIKFFESLLYTVCEDANEEVNVLKLEIFRIAFIITDWFSVIACFQLTISPDCWTSEHRPIRLKLLGMW